MGIRARQEPCILRQRRLAIRLMSAPTIVFDLDGTLIDTAPDLIDTLNLVFEQEGLPPVDYATARNLIGGGARAMIVRGIEAEGRAVTPAKLEQMFAEFIAHYSAHIADRSQPFPGLVQALDALAASGCRLAVCTNKLESLSRLLLSELKLTHRFAAICGQDTFGIQKPDPEVLRRTIAAAGGKTWRSVMIGDSLTDIRTARAAGIPVIAVDFGYSERPVSEFGPDRVISHFRDLPAAIAAISFAE
jgi:phosphoglycolate phosphatase